MTHNYPINLQFGQRTYTPPSRKFVDVVDSLKNEYENLVRENSFAKKQRDEFEQKYKVQMQEMARIQQHIVELERKHHQIISSYHQEIRNLEAQIRAKYGQQNGGNVSDEVQRQRRGNNNNNNISNLPPLTAKLPSRDEPPVKKQRVDNSPASLANPSVNTLSWLSKDKNFNFDLKHSIYHSSVVCCVDFSFNGSQLATGSKNMAQIFDVETGSETHLLLQNQNPENEKYVRAVKFSPDAKNIVTGSEDSVIIVWDVETKEQVGRLVGHEQEIYSLSYSPDGAFIASGSEDNSVKIWDAHTSECLYTFGPQFDITDGMTSVAFVNNGKHLIAGSLDKTMRLWDIETQTLLQRFKGHTNSIYSISVSDETGLVATGALDQTVKIWDINRSEEHEVMTCIGHNDFVLSVDFSPDGKYLVSGSRDKTVKIWDIGSGQVQASLGEHINSVITVAFSGDESKRMTGVATGGGDTKARIWKRTEQ